MKLRAPGIEPGSSQENALPLYSFKLVHALCSSSRVIKFSRRGEALSLRLVCDPEEISHELISVASNEPLSWDVPVDNHKLPDELFEYLL